MSKQGARQPVTLRATIQRINRKLKPDLCSLRKTRGVRAKMEFGEYHVIDYNINGIVQSDVDVESYARELEALHDWERVDDGTD